MVRNAFMICSLICLFIAQNAGAGTKLLFDQDFPDPMVLKARDGVYYGYATQTIVYNQIVNIQVARSRNFFDWDFVGDALPVKPAWASDTQKFWAPHVMEENGKYILFFSAKRNAPAEHCVGIATSVTPTGPFRDIGHPLICASGFTEIDPMVFDDAKTGHRYLYWGSGFGAIRVRELAGNLLDFAKGSREVALIQPTTKSYESLLEGAWMMEKGGYYYLFYSGSNCCEPSPHYAVMVARSKSPMGPFETLGDARHSSDSTILEAFDRYIAPGHNAVATAPDGTDWIIYHAIDINHMYLEHPIPDDRKVRRVLLASPLKFSGGWPVVNL